MHADFQEGNVDQDCTNMRIKGTHFMDTRFEPTGKGLCNPDSGEERSGAGIQKDHCDSSADDQLASADKDRSGMVKFDIVVR